MNERKALLHTLATTIAGLPAERVLRVGIDGVDGAGKSVFGDELAAALEAAGRRTIRASVDGFHNPRALRYRQGRYSPLGYFFDSYDYAQLKAVLLGPLSPGGDGRYRSAVFDHRADASVAAPEAQAVPGDILVFDGIFLHRPELREYWDFSIFLEVEFAVSIPRCARRDNASPDLNAQANRRYIEGQEYYLRTSDPRRHATLVIDNEVFEAPRIVRSAPT